MLQKDGTRDTIDRDLEVVRPLSQSAREPGSPGLLILYGLPGSGKSYFGELVAERCRAVILNIDRHRRAIVHGIPRYDGPENKRVFDALDRRTEELLDQGQVVVFDSSALREWIRSPLEKIASDRGLTPVRVHLDPPEDVIFARLRNRRPAPDPVDGVKTWLDVYDWMQPGWQPILEPHLRFDNPETLQSDVATVCRALCGDTAGSA